MTSQQTVVSSLADNNISIVFDPDGPKADLRNRIMYVRPLPDKLKKSDLEMVRGDCDHELGHFLHTDIDILESIDDELTRLVFNALEDGRVERLVSNKWFGCGENLRRSSHRTLLRIKRNRTGSLDCIRSRTLAALTLLSFGHDRSYVVEKLGKDISSNLDLLDDELYYVSSLEDSKATLGLARQIVFKISDWLYDTPITELETASISEKRKSIIKNKNYRLGDCYVAKIDEDVVTRLSPSYDALNDGTGFLEEIKNIVPIIRRRIIMDHCGSRLTNIRHKKKGKLDSRNLYKLATGSEKIFITEEMRPSINMDFTLMIDCSGSMILGENDPDGAIDALRLSGQCAAALSSVLDIVGVNNECLGFTTLHSESMSRIPGYDRVRPIRNIIIKDYRSSFQQCRYNFVELAYYKDAYENIDGESLLWAAQRAVNRSGPGTNKVMVVFSDGRPDSFPEKGSVLGHHLKSVIDRLEKAGFLMIGIGINCNYVKDFYDNYLICNNLENFAEVFFTAYRRLLKKISGKI